MSYATALTNLAHSHVDGEIAKVRRLTDQDYAELRYLRLVDATEQLEAEDVPTATKDRLSELEKLGMDETTAEYVVVELDAFAKVIQFTADSNLSRPQRAGVIDSYGDAIRANLDNGLAEFYDAYEYVQVLINSAQTPARNAGWSAAD